MFADTKVSQTAMFKLEEEKVWALHPVRTEIV